MAIDVQVRLRCGGVGCKQSIIVWCELDAETDGECCETGALKLSTSRLTLPSGWYAGRYIFGPYCEVHKERNW